MKSDNLVEADGRYLMIITVTLNPAQDKTLRVPHFKVGSHASAEVLSCIPAGKGINVARGLSRLGYHCVSCMFVGRREMDFFADALEEESDVDAAYVTVDGVTRTNTTILDPENSSTTHLREEGFRVTEAEIAELKQVLAFRIERVDERVTVAFCGSLPPGLCVEAFTDLLMHCHDAGARVSCDTSGGALSAAVKSGAVDTVKPNLSELSQCIGQKVARSEAVSRAKTLLDNVERVLLTLGPRGAYVIEDGQEVGMRCSLGDEAVQNTVGCGDAFLAGWLGAREEGMNSEQALQQAVAAGAASACGNTAVDYSRSHVQILVGKCEKLNA